MKDAQNIFCYNPERQMCSYFAVSEDSSLVKVITELAVLRVHFLLSGSLYHNKAIDNYFQMVLSTLCLENRKLVRESIKSS